LGETSFDDGATLQKAQVFRLGDLDGFRRSGFVRRRRGSLSRLEQGPLELEDALARPFEIRGLARTLASCRASRLRSFLKRRAVLCFSRPKSCLMTLMVFLDPTALLRSHKALLCFGAGNSALHGQSAAIMQLCGLRWCQFMGGPRSSAASFFFWLFVKSCGWILAQNEGEGPVDSGFVRICRRSEFARESEKIPACTRWRRREAGPGHFSKAAAFARRISVSRFPTH
jgi:hypothetical protein